MPLISAEAGSYRYNGGIYFDMLDGDKVVRVKVSDEALDDCERATRGRSNYMAIFGRHRYTIEGVGRRKFERRQREKDGSILVTTGDLNG